MASKALHLSDDDIKEIRRTWALAAKDPKGTGKLLSHVMFELFPKYEETFSVFKTEGIKSVKENPKFQKHLVENVLGTLGKLIENLDKDETVKASLHKLGVSHKKRKLEPQDFHNITEIVMQTLKRGLGPEMNSNAEAAWKKMMTLAMEMAGKGLK